MAEAENLSSESLVRRERFPRGLVQPEDAYRSGADALWLADFAERLFTGRSRLRGRFADLGTGCGAAALAWLLRWERIPGADWSGVGIEVDPELVEAARRNAMGLALEDRFDIFAGDVGDREFIRTLRGRGGGAASSAGFDLVLANPPWRLEGQGRVPPSPKRRRALFGTEATLPLFAGAAALLLRPGGRFACVVGAARLVDLCAALGAAALAPRRLRCIHARIDAPAMLVLVDAAKNGGAPGSPLAPLMVEPPLVISCQSNLHNP